MEASPGRSLRSMLGTGVMGSGVGVAIGALVFGRDWGGVLFGFCFAVLGAYGVVSGRRRDRRP
jgi:uncharacterized membrane protein